MKKIFVLAVLLVTSYLFANGQINARPTDEVIKPIFSGSDLEIKKIDSSYAFYYFDNNHGPQRSFIMDNKRSPQDIIDLAKKMYTNKKPVESYQFTKPGYTYRMEWFNNKVVLYILPNIGLATVWIIKPELLDQIVL